MMKSAAAEQVYFRGSSLDVKLVEHEVAASLFGTKNITNNSYHAIVTLLDM